jgi:glutathione S-transferase
MLKIFGRANSINVRKVLWICDELGILYTREDWGRGFRAVSEPTFQGLNPRRVVPAIDDDGVILAESNTIVRYLAEKHGRDDLFPKAPAQRFPIEAWMDWASTDLYWGVRPVFQSHAIKPSPVSPETVADGLKDWTLRMHILDDILQSTSGHLAGEAFTIADIPTGLIVNRWFMLPITKPDLPAVSAYYERLSMRPAYLTHGRNGTP